jgi:PAS domain S-box-containing protein
VREDDGLVIAASRELQALHAGARAGAGRAALLFGLLVAGSVSALALLQVRRRRGAALVEQADAQARLARDELERFFSITPDMLCVADLAGRFRRLNPAWEAVLGRPLAALEGAAFLDLVHPEDVAETTGTLERLAAGETVIDFTNRLRKADGDWRFIQWRAASKGPFIFAAARDVTERHLAARQALASLRDNERLVGELQEALQNVKTLAGMLPICMYCHRIRNDEGYWDRIEQYISAHSDATFSHGMCPSCYERQFPPGSP